jgi:hypothetical protein
LPAVVDSDGIAYALVDGLALNLGFVVADLLRHLVAHLLLDLLGNDAALAARDVLARLERDGAAVLAGNVLANLR